MKRRKLSFLQLKGLSNSSMNMKSDDSLEMTNKRIGIMGGTFNPIHNGHIELAKAAYEQYHLDEILFMPSGEPPHKIGDLIAPAVHRSSMVKLAIEPYEFMLFSDFELKQFGFSYTAVTLTELTKVYHNIYFIIGADSLLNLQNWYHPEIVMNLCTLLVANRDCHIVEELRMHSDILCKEYGAKIEFLNTPNIPISSTVIRENIKQGTSIRDFVPDKVANYINEHKLYRSF